MVWLSSDARQTIHEGALELLSEHGMRVDHLVAAYERPPIDADVAEALAAQGAD